MAPAVDATNSGSNSNSTSLTVSHTVGGGAERLLLVCGSAFNRSTGVTGFSSCTYGGSALSKLCGSGSSSNGTFAEIWMMINPPSGTANVVLSASSSIALALGSVSFVGADQTTGAVNRVATTGSSQNPSISGSGTVTTSVCVDSIGHYANTGSTSTGTAFLTTNPFDDVAIAAYVSAGSGSTSMSWGTDNNAGWGACMAEVLAYAATPRGVVLVSPNSAAVQRALN